MIREGSLFCALSSFSMAESCYKDAGGCKARYDAGRLQLEPRIGRDSSYDFNLSNDRFIFHRNVSMLAPIFFGVS
jgi:hypothetical protein